MALHDYNFFDGFGSNKKAQAAIVFGVLAGLGVGYFAFRPTV